MHASVGLRAQDQEDFGDWEECVEEKDEDETALGLENAGKAANKRSPGQFLRKETANDCVLRIPRPFRPSD